MFAVYRQVFAEPKLRSLMTIGLLAKMPGLGISAVILLHVVSNLDRGFGAASLVSALWTAGAGIGAPLQGRGLDRYGLRKVLALVVTAQSLFWGLAYLLPYPALLGAAFVGGLLTLPAFTVIRLALATMVTEESRHTAYVVDSMTTDLAYMVGPSIGIVLASQASPTVAFLVMGALLFLSGIAYLVLNPPLQKARPLDDGKPRLGDWLSPRMVCALGITVAASVAVMGFEVAAIGSLQRWGQLQWSWLLLVVAGLASVAGGLVYGGMRRPPSVFVVTAVLGLLCMPMGLATQWYWLCLLAVPANFFVAPALSASATSVSLLAPEGSKGVAMGAYASALLVGNVAGSPLAGVVMDHGGPVASFAALGATAAAIAGIAHLCDVRFRAAGTPEAAGTPQSEQPDAMTSS